MRTRQELEGLPAVLGGEPAFAAKLALARPSTPAPEEIAGDLGRIFESGILTNGPFARDLETRVAQRLSVAHCIAVSSCTSGLMLVLRAAGISGDVIVPSFTFAATAHAIVWAGCNPRFVDIDQETLTLAPSAAAASANGAVAILGTHLYGAPCDVDALDQIAERHDLRLYFDAAHAFGAKHGDIAVGGFGDAEVFSLTPTKPLVASEGGLITTNDEELADACRIGRDYANPGDYDCRFVGLNARMSEIHAAIALRSLDDLDERLDRRISLATTYSELLDGLEGITLPTVHEGDRSTYKDFTTLVEPDRFGLDAETVANALRAEGVETRRYYAPPVHRMQAYAPLITSPLDLPNTEHAAARVVTLPLWERMEDDDVHGVVAALRRIAAHADRLQDRS